VNFRQLCRDLLAVHREVGRLMFAAMMPGLTVEEIKRIKEEERRARDQRKKLAGLREHDYLFSATAYWPRKRSKLESGADLDN
jgi:hypothetical protein